MKDKNKNIMKKIVTLLTLLVSVTFAFGQSKPFKPDGRLYDGEIVFSQESELVDSLLLVYNVDTAGLEIISYHDEWDTLSTNFKQTIIVHSLNKTNNEVKCYSVTENENEVELKKYMVIVIFDLEDKKFLNIRLF